MRISLFLKMKYFITSTFIIIQNDLVLSCVWISRSRIGDKEIIRINTNIDLSIKIVWSYTFFWNIFSFDLNLTIERPIQFKLLIHKQKNMSLCHLGEQWIKVVIWICLHWINVESKTDYWDNETVYQAFFFNGQISGKLFLVVRVMCFIFF